MGEGEAGKARRGWRFMSTSRDAQLFQLRRKNHAFARRYFPPVVIFTNQLPAMNHGRNRPSASNRFTETEIAAGRTLLAKGETPPSHPTTRRAQNARAHGLPAANRSN